ncbi:SDR family oxidoreductase [Mucilaginibacter sp. BJC16-A38]|uniref:SDR family NAD(P)-dependent oxidoreductase n=1 Tax=Mucilaginibacter phenanthrenivorans TaxID=1234842 RepID=UPI0021571173|nr:SDR family oxidoreductase [Mucilaginibacter phenanthrenivorans]MCR8560028.1 SDR family oxidoreductase [Mucilaginibacter phenanthrenivorans]
MDISPKLAIVTGGASGIGLATTRAFVKAGIKTIIIGRNQDKLQLATDELGELCVYKIYDLTNIAGIPDLVSELVREHGVPDILVNNAGINMKKSFIEVTDQDFQDIIQINLMSVFSLSREVVKRMLEKGQGSIVNISSMAAQYGIPQVIAYTAAKSAIEGVTRAMATELSPGGIRVNCVAPGFIATEMSAAALEDDPGRKNKVLSRTPMGKLGDPDDVAAAILYLASDAAKFVTGVVLRVDGGNAIGF